MDKDSFRKPVGRFAPSPSGRMHLGNLFTALVSWLSVRSRGGKWILRIEDLDPQRSKPEHVEIIEDDLRWLGLDWDEGGSGDAGPSGPYSQSRRGHLYAAALARLEEAGLTYPCYCRRADLLASSAPHQSDGRIVYAGTCRPAPGKTVVPPADGRRGATRVIVPEGWQEFDDMVYGPQRVDLTRECGDFVLRRADGAWAYQLAVVVDDALMGVTEVVRGNDLLLSTGQQTYLYGLLGWEAPRFGHLPLVSNTEGLRLSKRDSSLNMESLRRQFSPAELTGRLAYVTGLADSPRPVMPSELVERFDWSMIRPEERVTVDTQYFSPL